MKTFGTRKYRKIGKKGVAKNLEGFHNALIITQIPTQYYSYTNRKYQPNENKHIFNKYVK